MIKKKIPRWLGWPILALWSYLVLLFWGNQALYHPSKFPDGPWHLQQEFGAEDVELVASDGVRIHGWFMSAGPDSVVSTLYLHGNAANLSYRVSHIRGILAAGSDLLIIDYRGYGKSEGRPSEPGLYRDAHAAYDWLSERRRVDQALVCHGESLGTAVAARLASDKPCDGVILEAPLPSVKAVAATVLPVIGPMAVSGFDTLRSIARIQCPLLVVHGDRDGVIPYRLGREVYESAREPKQFWTVDGAGHNDIVEAAGEEYRLHLASFYQALRR